MSRMLFKGALPWHSEIRRLIRIVKAGRSQKIQELFWQTKTPV
jgi:hypothetical protein